MDLKGYKIFWYIETVILLVPPSIETKALEGHVAYYVYGLGPHSNI